MPDRSLQWTRRRRRAIEPCVSSTESEAECLSSDPPVRTATRRCLRTRSRRAFAPTSARFAPRVSITSWKTCARTAAADSYPDPSDRRETGKVTTSWVRTLRVPRSSTGPLTRPLMRGSRLQSRPYRPTNDRSRDSQAGGAILAPLLGGRKIRTGQECGMPFKTDSGSNTWASLSRHRLQRRGRSAYRADNTSQRGRGLEQDTYFTDRAAYERSMGRWTRAKAVESLSKPTARH